jgi:hypothetical protein
MPGFPIARPVVFPLLGITADGKCACGNESCSRVGKHPAVSWGDVLYGSAVPRPEIGAGVGLRTGAHPQGSDVFVVDLDGDGALDAWEELGPCPDTLVIETPRGWHLYFKHPGFAVKTSAGEIAKGIDIRGEGGFVVAPGSPHRSGGSYTVFEDTPPADAPAWLLEWLQRQKAPSAAQHYPGDIVEPAERARRRELYAEYLRSEAPARGPELRGQGDQTLFNVVQRGAYDLALPVDDVLELVREHYDPRCSPPWADELEERVHHKAHDAKTSSTRPRAEPLPADLVTRVQDSFPAQEAPPPDAQASETDKLEAELKITWGRWDEPLPPAVYTISPIVPEATLGVIVAKGSSLKTWLVLSMLSAVARGQPWLGHFPCSHAPAMLIDFESGRDIIHERVQYLRTHDAPQLGIASFPNARIDDMKFWIALAKIVLARGVKLIAIDSFAAGATGVDENDAKSADPLHYAARFIEATRCAVVLIHHAKKGGESGDERDMVRGSGAIFGAADWIYTMVPQDEDRTKMLVRCIKAFRKKTDDFIVSLTIDGLVLDVSEIRTDEATKTQQRIFDTVRAVHSLHTLHEICRAAKVKSGTFTKEDVDSLIKQRRIVYLPKQGYVAESPAARLDRIKRATKTPGLSTPEALSKAAHVHVDDVHELMADGVVVKSGTGFIVSNYPG